jgi:hypothetical protein
MLFAAKKKINHEGTKTRRRNLREAPPRGAKAGHHKGMDGMKGMKGDKK